MIRRNLARAWEDIRAMAALKLLLWSAQLMPGTWERELLLRLCTDIARLHLRQMRVERHDRWHKDLSDQ